jgi:hypothetical protein
MHQKLIHCSQFQFLLIFLNLSNDLFESEVKNRCRVRIALLQTILNKKCIKYLPITAVLNLRRHRATFISCYRITGCKGKFVEMPMKFIKRKKDTRLSLGSHVARYLSLTTSVISEIPEAAFAAVIFQYQFK